MKPEPPSGVAIPYASPAPASGTIWSQPAVHEPSSGRHHDDRGGSRTADDAAQDPVPDLLRDEASGRAVADRAGLGLCHRERDEEERHADAVVQPALDVQALPDPRREPRQRHDRLAECGVGRRQHDRENERFSPRQLPENAEGGERTRPRA